MKQHITLCIANSVICDLASMFAGSALTRICRYHISKHLKGQLGPRVGDVTFFNQRRSVGAPRLSRDVFGSKEVSWDPVSVT